MSKWLKLLNQAEHLHLDHPSEVVARASDHHELESSHHGITSRFYMIALTVITAVALSMAYKMTETLKVNQADRGKMMASYNQQQVHLKSLEQEVVAIKVEAITKLQSAINEKQTQLEQLSIENDLLKIQLKDMEYSQQEMINEINSLTQETPQNIFMTEGRKI